MKHLLSFLIFITSFYHAYTQIPSTQGKEFYFSFMQNGYRTCNSGGNTTYESLSCIISSQKNCSGTISNPNTGWSTNFSVFANGITTIPIPVTQSYSTNSEVVENLGLIVSATDTISLYIANEATNSFDASNVLPTGTLGNKYVMQCYIPSPSGVSGACSSNVKSAFIIIATENNTIVDITPTCQTRAGRQAYTPFTITLNKGQSYQVMSNERGANGNLSGSIVEARDCKKIAVFNGNILTGIPISETDGFDHIFEQAIPVFYWGNQFAITGSVARKGDFCRITTLSNNTHIKLNNIVQATINEYETYEFLLSDSSAFLETSNPCAVFLYQTTGEYDHSPDGDPSMLWITPIEQQVKEITFGTFTATNTINHHYVNIVTATSDVSSMTLNGLGISRQFSPLTGNRSLSFARIEIPHGTHTLKSDSGFTAFVYGFGNVRGYAYSVGSSAIDLSRNVIINNTDLLSETTTNNRHYCLNEILNLKLNTNYEYESIQWNMGDGTVLTTTSHTISHQYKKYGKYVVTIIVKHKSQNCRENLYDTIRGIINIPDRNIIIKDAICYGEDYTKYGFNIPFDSASTQIGTIRDTLRLKDTYNCDSTHILSLTVNPVYSFMDTMIVCRNAKIYWRDKQVPTSTLGSFILSDSLKTHSCNCDSIYNLLLTVTNEIPIKLNFNDTLFCNGDTIKFSIPPYTPFVNLQWTGPDNFSSSLYDPVIPNVSVQHSGIYTAKADTVDGCIIIPDSIRITVLPPIDLRLEDTVLICVADTIHTYCTGADTYLWNTGETNKDIIVSSSGTYRIKANNQRCSAYDTTTVIEINSLVFPINKTGDLCEDDSILLFVSLGNVQYQWSTGDTTSMITVSSEGEYHVTLSYEGCSTSQSIEVICPCEIILPNIFTPNNDGFNDLYIPDVKFSLNSFSMYIYDRWGRLVYQTDTFTPWDGKRHGTDASAGVYYCVIYYTCSESPNVMRTSQSSVTLVR